VSQHIIFAAKNEFFYVGAVLKNIKNNNKKTRVGYKPTRVFI